MGHIQEYIPLIQRRFQTQHHDTVSRLLRSVGIGFFVTLIITLLQVLVFAFHDPFALLGSVFDRDRALLILPIGELLSISMVLFFILRPLAIYAYIRILYRECQHAVSHLLSIPAYVSIQSAVPLAEEEASEFAQQRELVSLVDVLQQREGHVFLLGAPGMGKTQSLQLYLAQLVRLSWSLAWNPVQLPIFVSLRDYSLFLQQRRQIVAASDTSPDLLIHYIRESRLPGRRQLRPYLSSLFERGQLVFFCDGLDEVEGGDETISLIVNQLITLMQHRKNRIVITCRSIEYRMQKSIVKLVNDRMAMTVFLHPFRRDMIDEFVESYIEQQDKQWRHTAGQMMHLLRHSRLHYYAGNLMVITLFMQVIDKLGIERGQRIKTRGILVREHIVQLLERESRNARWGRNAPAKEDVLLFVSTLASAVYGAQSCDAVQLPTTGLHDARGNLNMMVLAAVVTEWLRDHPPLLPFELEEEAVLIQEGDGVSLLQLALQAGLIAVTADGVLHFQHTLLASYLVAGYCSVCSQGIPVVELMMREEMLERIDHWCQPVVLWAGLLDDPLELADRFGVLALTERAYVPSALALGLCCIGVGVTPPRVEMESVVNVPPNFERALRFAVQDRTLCEGLAQAMVLCAENGVLEVYYALLPLISFDRVENLFTYLEEESLLDILFQYLQDVIDHPAYEAETKRLIRLLSCFGGLVVERASQLSLPVPERSLRLRAATLNILGGTCDELAVEPLIACLSDTEPVIVERAEHALFRLGPMLTLDGIFRVLANRVPNVVTVHMQRAILHVMRRFMEGQDARKRLTDVQYKQVMEHLLLLLASHYQFEPENQLLARALLIDQACMVSESDAELSQRRSQQVIDALIAKLSQQQEQAIQTPMEMLIEIGALAVPRLVLALRERSELFRLRVISILQSIRDLSAMPALLELMNDPVLVVRQQVAVALSSFAPEVIPHLIKVVLISPNESEAEAAAQILIAIGELAVEPVIAQLTVGDPARTRLLVYVLERIHDPRAVPVLIALQGQSQAEPLLTITLVQALGQFQEREVVGPLIEQMTASNPQVYEEAIIALSQLREIALPDLLQALESEQETVITQRIQRAILGMSPFPGEHLIAALEEGNELLFVNLEKVFVQQGYEAAFLLVKGLVHPKEQIQTYISHTLEQMAPTVVVPALLDALYDVDMLEIVGRFLLHYPDEAITSLVDLLGEPARGNVAATILQQFGIVVFRPLLVALADQRMMARELARRIIITLVRRQSELAEACWEVIQLFAPPLPGDVSDQLIDLLVFELGDVSLTALLNSLVDTGVLEPVVTALSRLALRQNMQQVVIEKLCEMLFVDGRRRGCEEALIKIGALAVHPVGNLITDQNPAVARSAKRILREIGVPALPFIWMAQSDRRNMQRREAAVDILRSMPVDVIKGELITLLVSEKRDDIVMAVSLLLERVYEEKKQGYAKRVMVPELIAYIQQYQEESVNLRIIALLLLVGEEIFFAHLMDCFAEGVHLQQLLLYMLLFLSEKRREEVVDLFDDPETKDHVRVELASVLGLVMAPRSISDYARRISTYGLVKNGAQIAAPEKLTIALRSLGGLLASGQWDIQKLQAMRNKGDVNEPARELFSVLLGWRYEPVIAKMEVEMEAQREAFKKRLLLITGRLVEEQKRAQTAESELEKLKEEHGLRGEELQKLTRERDSLRANVGKLTRESSDLRSSLEQIKKAKNSLASQYERLKREHAALQQQQAGKPVQ
jgi:HEAT repeat protein